jgi:hypothetical protein
LQKISGLFASFIIPALAAFAHAQARPKTEKTLYLASSGEDTEGTQRFADILGK